MLSIANRCIPLFLTLLLSVTITVSARTRPSHWAVPVELEGCPNLYRVSDTLYRGAQPTQAGMAALEKFGIKTVVSLRSFHSDRDEIEGTALVAKRIKMNAWNAEYEEVLKVLRILIDENQAPVFVHCLHGADRTGAICAVYRIVVKGWTKEEALEEMKDGGFGYHAVWLNLPRWIEKLDVKRLQRDLGLPESDSNQSEQPPQTNRHLSGGNDIGHVE